MCFPASLNKMGDIIKKNTIILIPSCVWTTKRSNQSIPKEINPEYSFEGLMLKLQYFGHLMWRADSLEKTLILGKIEGKRRSRWQSMICLGSITDSMDMSLSKLGDSEGQEVWRAAIHGVAKNWTWLSDWTATTNLRGYWSMQDPLLVCLPEWCFGESNSLAWEFKAWIAWKNQKTSWLRHWT